MDCLFCKIAAGEIPGDIVYRDEEVLAFRDINPQAPIHILVIPIEHVTGMNDFEPSHQALLGKLMLTAQKIAKDEGVAEDGYRLVVNTNKHGGQAVYHTHIHLLAGRPLGWPPG